MSRAPDVAQSPLCGGDRPEIVKNKGCLSPLGGETPMPMPFRTRIIAWSRAVSPVDPISAVRVITPFALTQTSIPTLYPPGRVSDVLQSAVIRLVCNAARKRPSGWATEVLVPFCDLVTMKTFGAVRRPANPVPSSINDNANSGANFPRSSRECRFSVNAVSYSTCTPLIRT